MKEIILAIDTSGEVMGVAVSRGNKLLAERYIDCGLKHSVNLMDGVEGCLCDAKVDISDVDAFVVVAGPGSFTGIRIGVCTAKAFCAVGGKKGFSVNALDALSVAGRGRRVCALIDARNEQVYAAVYDERGVCTLADYAGDIKELLPTFPADMLFVGNGAAKYREIIENLCENPQFLPDMLTNSRAAFACVVANENKDSFVNGEDIQPIYVRKSGAERMKNV